MNKKTSGMFEALPAPSQVYIYAEKKPQSAPLTVSEGRQWLSDFVNDKELMHFSYTRYIENKIRDTFGFRGTSLKFIIRERKDKEN